MLPGHEAESEFDEPKKQPSKQPSVIHQAIMNEACLQALFHTPVQNGEFRKELNTKVYDEYRKRATAAEVVSPKVLPAIMARNPELGHFLVDSAAQSW
ncbi:Peptidase S1Bglutamyl endopeptidase I [Penicillium lividum]|nr:Peptidase S1Bglutamyl endopeptidase I [Penicillium lividum]